MSRFVALVIGLFLLVVSPAMAEGGLLFWVQYNEAGKKQFQAQSFAQAELNWLQALAISEDMGKQDPRVAESLINLGRLYEAQGKLDREAEVLQRAVLLKRQIYGKDNKETQSCAEAYERVLRTIEVQRNEAIEVIPTLPESHPSSEGATTLSSEIYKPLQQRLASAGSISSNSNDAVPHSDSNLLAPHKVSKKAADEHQKKAIKAVKTVEKSQNQLQLNKLSRVSSKRRKASVSIPSARKVKSRTLRVSESTSERQHSSKSWRLQNIGSKGATAIEIPKTSVSGTPVGRRDNLRKTKQVHLNDKRPELQGSKHLLATGRNDAEQRFKSAKRSENQNARDLKTKVKTPILVGPVVEQNYQKRGSALPSPATAKTSNDTSSSSFDSKLHGQSANSTVSAHKFKSASGPITKPKHIRDNRISHADAERSRTIKALSENSISLNVVSSQKVATDKGSRSEDSEQSVDVDGRLNEHLALGWQYYRERDTEDYLLVNTSVNKSMPSGNGHPGAAAKSSGTPETVEWKDAIPKENYLSVSCRVVKESSVPKIWRRALLDKASKYGAISLKKVENKQDDSEKNFFGKACDLFVEHPELNITLGVMALVAFLVWLLRMIVKAQKRNS